jgi:hypothetical protein
MSSPSRDLAIRLQPFVQAGLLPALPTWWQLRQGELEMIPFVLSSDATDESRYAPWLGHPWIRQPIILWQVGRDHLRAGSGLGTSLSSLCKHLHLTHHLGMPVYDLQLVQTHAGGLDRLERETVAVLAGSESWARRRRRVVGLLLQDPPEYLERFLGADGWIARARRFEYPAPTDEGSPFPPEFYSLASFCGYCAERFPKHPRDLGWSALPMHLASRLTRRLRGA